MANQASTSINNDKWYFTKEQLENTPSRKCGFDAYKELQYRQQAANFIQDMGQRLQVSQLCINTAIVYMHRFYVFHSFTNFPWHQMAAAALFLAAKVEEQPRKLEYVIKVAHICKNPKDRSFDVNSERYIAQSQDLVFNENVLLQTLGFTVAIDHPHTYVVKCCHLVRASKDLAQTSYFMASNSLHLTTMCIQYKPTVVACFCILLACKWSNWEIPLSTEKKEWFTYVDQTVTAELLQQLTSEFLEIFENCPSRLKEKIMAKQEQEKRPEGSTPQRSLEYKGEDPHKHRASRPPEAPPSGSSHRSQEQRDREYKERKEKERMAHMSGITLPPIHHHHRPSGGGDPKLKPHGRPSGAGNPPYPPPRDILRETKESPFGIPGMHKDPYATARVSDSKVKSEIKTEPVNSLTNYRVDPSRTRVDPPKSSSSSSSSSASSSKQQDMLRRYEEQQKQQQQKQPSFKPSTSQKVSSSLVDNKQQSVPTTKTTINHPPQYNSKQFINGNTNGSYTNIKQEIKSEPVVKEEIPTPAVIKRPSLFSPEPEPAPVQIKSEPGLTKAPSLTSLGALSPINSPASDRNRNCSSSSEPELRPTMKKIDQVEGFENLMRDSTIGMTRRQNSCSDTAPVQQGQELTHLEVEVKTERISPIKEPPSSISSLVNGLETNPILISNLLKEASTMSGVPVVKTEPLESVANPPEYVEKEHKHHKSKKKKEKHKHRDRTKEEKEKKKKHKDKDREKHRRKERKEEVEAAPLPSVSEPIRITIQKDKIHPVNELKIKIPKDKIKTEGIVDSFSMSQSSSGGLKIKIPKDKITNCNTSGSSLSSLDISLAGHNSSSRKRERDRNSSPMETPASKVSKSGHKDKHNGRHSSYTKVSEQIDNAADSSEIVSVSDENNAQIIEPSTTTEVKDVSSSTVETASLSPMSSPDILRWPLMPLSPISDSGDSPVSQNISEEPSKNEAAKPISPPPESASTQNPPHPPLAPPHNQFKYVNCNYKPRPMQFQKNYRYNNNYAGGFNNNAYRPRKMMNPRHPRPPRPPHFHNEPNMAPWPPQMPPFNPYHQMGPPPGMPNMNVPPPSFGMYPGYYGFMYHQPDMYQHQQTMGVAGGYEHNQPPLPTDAPPSNEAPPPPPPPE